MREGLSTVRILVVEDHQFQREMVVHALRSLGAGSVLSATNGAEAIRALRTPGAEIDLVITDVMMPEVDGIELIPMLHKASDRVALILSSSQPWALQISMTIAESHGIAVLGGIEKPVTPDKLR